MNWCRWKLRKTHELHKTDEKYAVGISIYLYESDINKFFSGKLPPPNLAIIFAK